MILFDLNLLATFDALYELRSTTLAADRLGLTQSAVSHALRRLRAAVGDPVFVRGGGALQPTARAIEMAPGVREGLAKLRAAIAPHDFDPGTARRTITISAGSYFCTLIAPQLITWCRSVATNIHIRLVPIEQNLPALLDDGSVDLAIGVFDQVPARFATQPLFEDEFVWVAASNHALAGKQVSENDIERFAQLLIGTPRPFGLPRALLSGGGIEMRNITDVGGLEDRAAGLPAGSVYDVQTALAIAGSSDMLVRVPRRMAAGPGRQAGVIILEPRERQASFLMNAIWHTRANDDSALLWLREKLGTF